MSRLSECGGQSFVARLYAELLVELRKPDAAYQLVSRAQGVANELPQVRVFEKANDVPKHAFLWTSTERCLLIDGATDNAQARKLVNGYKASITGPYERPRNQFLVDCAVAVAANARSVAIPPLNVVTIAGYSMGGAIAGWIANARYTNPWMGNEPQVITIGSPRVGCQADIYNMARNTRHFRYFCFDDPVPLIPLHADESTAFAVYSGRFDSINYGRFIHPNWGIEVSNTGTFSSRQTPSNPVNIPRTDLLLWYIGYGISPPFAHTLEAFIARVLPADPTPVRFLVPRNTPIEAQANTNAREQTIQEARVSQAVLVAEREQGAVPLRIPVFHACVATRIGRDWGVYFGTSLICVRRSKKVARHLARSFNEFLERLQTSALVDPNNMVETLRAYLNEASDPQSAFRPTMRTVLPIE